MNKEFHNLYNNLIKLSRNKILYENFTRQDTFSDRLIFFLIHFAFFIKTYKNKDNTKLLQDIYDYIFRQLELSIREIGYGDQSINKKMKDYINFFHNIVSEIHFWEKLNDLEKKKILASFFDELPQIDHIYDYFDVFSRELQKKKFDFLFKQCK